MWLVRVHKFKAQMNGPWDEAVPKMSLALDDTFDAVAVPVAVAVAVPVYEPVSAYVHASVPDIKISYTRETGGGPSKKIEVTGLWNKSH